VGREGAIVAHTREMHGVAGRKPKWGGKSRRHFLRSITKKITSSKHCWVCLGAGKLLLQLLHVIFIRVGGGGCGVAPHGPTPWPSKASMSGGRVVP